MVTTSVPLVCTANTMQDFTWRPCHSTVQAPHFANYATDMVPVKPKVSRQHVNEQGSRLDLDPLFYTIYF
jgi:hypothetical protein